ncbi:MAG: flagellar type III secretion system pore protein FliP [Candidatus Loosdrechtia sp.]|uniref:flagellar type III secretion system pore protein FliP n=1 Tax=Candidatus Loosdrechtia sp. TaxID=3101272 RepID=UPI003A74A18D|nr:MAG: flagellar type III secretion system pore protein FliP [Candidatus Jettenia sp. AMX2]
MKCPVKLPMLMFSIGIALLLIKVADADASNESIQEAIKNMTELNEPKQLANTVKILLVMTSFIFLPAFLMVMTSFTRIIIVLSFARSALAVQQMPPNQILIGLAILVTYFVMNPVFVQINQEAIQPYMQEEITQEEAFNRGMGTVKTFMLKHTRERDIALFYNIAEMDGPESPDEVPARIILPAFVMSELKTAFQMGLVVYLPFVVIDIVVASVLTSMGMFMLPPMMISIPFKIVLFVLVDGWHLILQSLVSSIK